MPLQVRRGPTADRTSFTPVIGELIYDTVEKTLYVGDGATPGGVASSSFTFEDAQDASAALFTSGVHSNINFSYNDTAARIDASIDLTNYSGVIEADGLKGSVFAADSTLLVDSVLASFNLDGTVRTDIVPFASEAYDLGTPTNKFKDLYLSGSSLWLGDAQITASGSAVNLPAGSTVNGSVIGAGSGSGDGVVEGSNYRINIVGDDSTVIVDSSTNSINASGGITGDLTGNVNGSVFGDDSTLLVDGVASRLTGIIDNAVTTSQTINGGTVQLSGLNNVGEKAGIEILTDGSAEDAYSLFNIIGRNPGPDGQSFVFERGRGSHTAPASLENGDEILTMAWFGLDTNVQAMPSAAIRVTVNGAVSAGIVPGKLELATYNALGDPVVGLGIDSNQIIDVADNTVLADSGAGTADVTGGVVTYLKIKVEGIEYAIPLFGIVP